MASRSSGTRCGFNASPAYASTYTYCAFLKTAGRSTFWFLGLACVTIENDTEPSIIRRNRRRFILNHLCYPQRRNLSRTSILLRGHGAILLPHSAGDPFRGCEVALPGLRTSHSDAPHLVGILAAHRAIEMIENTFVGN